MILALGRFPRLKRPPLVRQHQRRPDPQPDKEVLGYDYRYSFFSPE